MTTFKIDYRSGVESEQCAGSALDALRAEYAEAGAEMPEIETTFSGGEWDFAIYDKDNPHYAYSTEYFCVVK